MRKGFLISTFALRKVFSFPIGREAELGNQSTRIGRATIHDVARAAGVSVSTVSKALNDNGRMAPETRARIKQVAENIGFRPNALARSLLFNRSFTIGLLTNDTYGGFTLPVMAGVSDALVDKGGSVFLRAIEDDPALGKIHVDAMLDKQVDGIIAPGKRIDRSLPVDLSGLPVPVVYAFTEGAPDSVTLTSDDTQGAGLRLIGCSGSAGGGWFMSRDQRNSPRCASAPWPSAPMPAPMPRCFAACGWKGGGTRPSPASAGESHMAILGLPLVSQGIL